MQNKIVYSLRRISGLSEAHTVISILTIHANGFAKYYHWLKEGIYCYCCQIDKKKLYFMTILIEEAL